MPSIVAASNLKEIEIPRTLPKMQKIHNCFIFLDWEGTVVPIFHPDPQEDIDYLNSKLEVWRKVYGCQVIVFSTDHNPSKHLIGKNSKEYRPRENIEAWNRIVLRMLRKPEVQTTKEIFFANLRGNIDGYFRPDQMGKSKLQTIREVMSLKVLGDDWVDWKNVFFADDDETSFYEFWIEDEYTKKILKSWPKENKILVTPSQVPKTARQEVDDYKFIETIDRALKSRTRLISIGNLGCMNCFRSNSKFTGTEKRKRFTKK